MTNQRNKDLYMVVHQAYNSYQIGLVGDLTKAAPLLNGGMEILPDCNNQIVVLGSVDNDRTSFDSGFFLDDETFLLEPKLLPSAKRTTLSLEAKEWTLTQRSLTVFAMVDENRSLASSINFPYLSNLVLGKAVLYKDNEVVFDFRHGRDAVTKVNLLDLFHQAIATYPRSKS